jgi:endonuclease/exonuclease/phosphatase family metal-dependent hydrolase
MLPAAAWAQATSKVTADPRRHRILSCNIRVDLEADAGRGVGWNDRRDTCVAVIRAHTPDIFCTQEVLRGQNEDLKQAFPGFQSFGFEGPEMLPFPEGYHFIAKNVIYFSRDRYELISAGCYWLSDTPHIGGSKAWGTARARQLNWVWLMDKASGRSFRVLDAHLDHLSQEARERQMAMILDEAAQYPAGFPQLLAGDLNVDASNPVYPQILERGWANTYADIHGEEDPGFTFHGFHGRRYPEMVPPARVIGQIDFIFARGGVTPHAAAIIRDDIDGRYPSDHFFISADFSLT